MQSVTKRDQGITYPFSLTLLWKSIFQVKGVSRALRHDAFVFGVGVEGCLDCDLHETKNTSLNYVFDNGLT